MFMVLSLFVMVMLTALSDSSDLFTHIYQGSFSGTGAIILPQRQRRNPDKYGSNWLKSNHNQRWTIYIILGMYRISVRMNESVCACVSSFIWWRCVCSFNICLFSRAGFTFHYILCGFALSYFIYFLLHDHIWNDVEMIIWWFMSDCVSVLL